MSVDRDQQLREEGKAQERARLLALLKRHDIIRIRDGQVRVPIIFGWEHDPKFIGEWDGFRA